MLICGIRIWRMCMMSSDLVDGERETRVCWICYGEVGRQRSKARLWRLLREARTSETGRDAAREWDLHLAEIYSVSVGEDDWC